MNVRELLGIDDDYSAFNREERHLAAIFFHVLHVGDNLRRFLDAAQAKPVAAGFEPTVSFEFAYLRDAWHRIDSNQAKRGLIRHFLPSAPADADTHAFNLHFGATPKASRSDIQSPSNWSLAGFDLNISSNEDFLETCRFKWSFNAKPDIVIRTGPECCLCIEAKLESSEASYPSSRKEKPIFKRRGLAYVRQTDLQRYMLKELLGFETEFIFLSLRPPQKASHHRFLTWSDAFGAMSRDGLPRHMMATIDAMT